MSDNQDVSKKLNETQIIQNIQEIIETAQKHAIRSVNFEQVQMYWKIGKCIYKDEQANQNRAGYGKNVIAGLSKSLTTQYGSGFSKRLSVQFYRIYTKLHALRAQLNWM